MSFDQTDVLLLPGNPSLADNHDWFYNNDMMIKDFKYPLDILSTAPNPSQNTAAGANNNNNNNAIIFEHYTGIPTSDMTPASPLRRTPSPPMSLSQPFKQPGRSSPKKHEITGPKRGRSSKIGTTSEDDSPETKFLRRREQNRIAQRTFRERKDRYIQNLESHIKDLNAKQQSLEANYKQSTDQVSALYTQLIELQTELEYWRSYAHTSPGPSTPSETATGSMHSPIPIPTTTTTTTTTHQEATEIMQSLQLHQFCTPPQSDFSHMPS